ncbi:MAG: ABC transporter ATP-binding protein [Saccharofermentanales bacterium]
MLSSESYVVEAVNVSKSFGAHKILDKISMNVKHHEIVSVLGISGSGKTTLFHLISGMLAPEEGIIETDSKIGYMMQKDLLMPWKTVIDNIALPLILKGVNKKNAYKKVSLYLGQFGLTGTSGFYPNMLSGGMRQRAALLRTYLQSGEVLLLDEPFSSVDAITRHQLHQWLLEIFNELSLSILLITHDIEEALLLSDRIYVLAGNPAGIAQEIKISDPRTGRFEGLSSDERNRARENIYSILEGEFKNDNE